jgi:PAS domain S-box-containing protein
LLLGPSTVEFRNVVSDPRELITDAVLAANLDGTIQFCNDATSHVFGYDATALIGTPLAHLVAPERREEQQRVFARVRSGDRVNGQVTRLVRGDGAPLDALLSVSPYRDASGAVVGAFTIVSPIDLAADTRTPPPSLDEADAYLAAIVESSDDAILTKDLDGIIQTANLATERLFGYTQAELIGQPVRILIPPDRQAEEDDILARMHRGERVDHFETVRLTKDGRPIDISLTVSPVRDATGTIVGVSKTARDITERKRAAAALDAQREWFRVTLASIGDAVIAADPRGHVSYMNATAETLTGWTAADAEGRPLAEVFHIINEKSRQPVENPAALVIRLGHIVGLANHTVLISRDGTERPIADSAAPIRDGSGAIIGVVLVFRDVTEERLAEDAIAEQREWLETTLESIGDAVIATDVRGHIVFMNPVAEHLTGWRVDAARGRACTDVFTIINEQTRRTVENPVTRVLAAGIVVGLANHTILIAADGTERPIDDSGAPIRNRDGRIVGVVLVFRDVTERRRAEMDRQIAAAERERLLEAERVARTEAERASRVKDDFVAMVSHELRTPLNAILGWTQLMARNRQDDAVLDRGLDVVARNTRLQAQLIADLLDISRIVSGKLRLDIQNVDLVAVVREAIETVHQEASAKHITIRQELETAIGPVAGDPGRLQQVVWNLLSNAIKFTSIGGQIVVTLRRIGDELDIAVADTGVGIRAEVLPQLFDRFHQADRSITRRFGGLGLGLSIVKTLVEMHGGSVRADSPGEGQGATFTMTLPSSRIEAPPALIPTTTAAADEAVHTVSLGGIRMLVVEDEPDTREFLKRLLESRGASVALATSAPDALAIWEVVRPELLISDIGLPGMDGYDLMQQIRLKDVGDGGGIPAVALTAYARSEDRTRALLAGFQAHLAKPVEPAELLATIASFAELIETRRKE